MWPVTSTTIQKPEHTGVYTQGSQRACTPVTCPFQHHLHCHCSHQYPCPYHTFKQVHFYSDKCTTPAYVFLFYVCGTAEIRPRMCITDYLKLLQNGTLQIRLFNVKWVQRNQGSYQTLKMSSATHREVTCTHPYEFYKAHFTVCKNMPWTYTHIYIYTHHNKSTR